MVRGEGGLCAYCKREMVNGTETHPTRDHFFPKSKGGREIVMACNTCNNIKGDMLPEEWRQFRLDNPNWFKDKRYPSKRAKFRHKRQQTIKLCTAAEAKRMGFRGPKPGETRLIPIEYDDPEKQAGFEHVYRGREFLLR